MTDSGARPAAVGRGRAQLPPRVSLPREVVVPPVPGLGLSWYDRHGAGYWGRRAGMTLLWLFATALATLITLAILVAFYHRSLAGFAVVLVLEIAYSVAILAFSAVATARALGDPRAAAIRPRGGPGQLFWGLSFLFTGLYLGLLLTSLLPETPAERRARQQVAGELSRRGHALSGS